MKYQALHVFSGCKYVHILCYCVSIGIVYCMFMFYVRRPTSGPWAVRYLF